MLNLVLICEHYYPEIGGLERSTHRLAQAFIAKGNKVTVLAPLREGTRHRDQLDNVTIIRSKHAATKPFTASDISLSLLNEADAILVFGIGDDPHAGIWQPIFCIKGAPKFLKIGTAGDTVVKNVPAPIIRNFDGIFCQNEEIAAEVKRIGFQDSECHTIRNGLDINEWQKSSPSKSEARKSLSLISPDSFIISAIGRFVQRKRFPDIIEAFAKAHHRGLQASLLLHGSDFGQSDGEEQIIRNTVNDYFSRDSIPIQIVTPDVPTSYTLAASDISVSIGTREGAPNIILESLASGVPIIASDISGHRVYINQGQEGWLCDSDSTHLTHDLANLFATAANCNNLCNMSKSCLARATQFDISRTSDMYLNPIKKVLGL